VLVAFEENQHMSKDVSARRPPLRSGKARRNSSGAGPGSITSGEWAALGGGGLLNKSVHRDVLQWQNHIGS
jgi:hypothetical protein